MAGFGRQLDAAGSNWTLVVRADDPRHTLTEVRGLYRLLGAGHAAKLKFRKAIVREFERRLHTGVIEANATEVESSAFTETVAFAQPWPMANENHVARVKVLPEKISAARSGVTRDTIIP